VCPRRSVVARGPVARRRQPKVAQSPATVLNKRWLLIDQDPQALQRHQPVAPQTCLLTADVGILTSVLDRLGSTRPVRPCSTCSRLISSCHRLGFGCGTAAWPVEPDGDRCQGGGVVESLTSTKAETDIRPHACDRGRRIAVAYAHPTAPAEVLTADEI
jgi:hypothetical protein